MKISSGWLLTLAVAVGAASSSHAQSSESDLSYDQLKALSLEELLAVRVITTSKTLEEVSDAPGAISTLSRREIDAFGARTLLEVLERMPSLYMIGSHLYRDNVIGIRGDVLTHFNSHVLILVNGRPVRESVFGGVDNAFLRSFPVEAVERIEVIRGPGSVLYGSNAFSGVVNILTRSGDAPGADAIFRYGTFNTFQAGGSGRYALGDAHVQAGLSYSHDDGWPYEAVDSTGVAGSMTAKSRSFGAQLNADYKGLTLAAAFGVLRQSMMGKTVTVWPEQPYASNRGYFDLGYSRELTKRLTLSANATLNLLSLEFPVPNGNFTASSNDLLFEVTGRYQALENLAVLVGGTANNVRGRAKTDDAFSAEEYSRLLFTGYAQVDFTPLPALKLIGGAQLNAPAGRPVALVPRAGAIFKPTEHWGGKLLYGRAYRAPVEGELNLVVPGSLIGNPNLNSETIGTLDLQLYYQSKELQASLGYFESLAENLLVRVPGPSGGNERTYANQGRLMLRGAELELKASPLEDLFITGSLTYQENGRTLTETNATSVPNTLGKLGVTYAWRGLTAGLFYEYVGAAGDIAVTAPARKKVNPPADAYHALSAAVTADVLGWWRPALARKLFVRLEGSNLLDADIQYPEFNKKLVNTLPGRPGRALYLGLGTSL